MKNFFKLLITLLAVLVPLGLYGQNEGADMQKMVQIPPSPEASGFIEYGKTDINYHLGRPNISVPIYNHQGREMSLPITLSYSASGIKTQQMASNVGLGWTLITGGAITRIKLGMADDDGQASPNWAGASAVQDIIDFSDSTDMGPGYAQPTAKINQFLAVQDGIEINSADSQADAYSLSTSTGLSTRIYWDYGTQKAYATDDPTLKITAGTDGNGRPTSWIVVDASGTKYEFTKTEQTEYTFSIEANEYTSNYVSAWFLDKITSPNGKDVYEFNYTYEQYWQAQEELLAITSITNRPTASGHATTAGGLACPVIPSTEAWSNPSFYKIRQQTPTSITWNGETIFSLFYASNRLDIPSGKEITSARVYKGFELLKEISFHYSHFGDVNANDRLKVRLKLDSLIIDGKYNTATPPPGENEVWKFEYDNPDLVPSRATLGVDYWGFYNGKTNNTSTVPSATWGSYNFTGGDRSPDVTKSVYGTLKKMYFPTGGYNELNYEAHDQIDISETIITDYSSLGSVSEGTDVNDTNAFCFSSPATAPNSMTGTITVDGESKSLKIAVSGGPATLAPGEFVVAYLFPETTGWDHCYADSVATAGTGIEQYVGNQIVELPLDTMSAGTYRYLVYNSFPNSMASLSYGQLDTVTNTSISNTIGGFRIASIQSKQADGTVSLTREFEYDDSIEQTNLNFIELKTTRLEDDQVSNFTCQTFYRYSNNRNTGNGKDVTYGEVTEKLTNAGVDNGYTVYKFAHGTSLEGTLPIHTGGQNEGKLIETSVYDTNDVLLQKTENFYSVQKLSGNLSGVDRVNNLVFEAEETIVGVRVKYANGSDTTLTYDYVTNEPGTAFPAQCLYNTCVESTWTRYNIRHYNLDAYFSKLDSSMVTQYFDSDSVVSMTAYTYDQTKHFQLLQQETEDSQGNTLVSKNYYPDDVIDTLTLLGGAITASELEAIDSMKIDAYHQINRVIQSEQYKNSGLKSITRNNFDIWNSGPVMPESVEITKDTLLQALEKRVEYVSYDSDNNPVEIKQIGGTPRSFIWGHDAALPIIQADNIHYDSLQTAVSWAVTNMTSQPAGVTDLESLLDYIGPMTSQSQIDAWTNFNSKLREHSSISSSVMLISMVYNPLKSMLAQTDPNGLHTFYEYDSMGRLKRVIDNDGNVIQTYKYNFKGQ